MLVEVPLPVWKTSSTNWSSNFALGHRLGGANDRPGQLGREQAEIHVHLGRALLDQADGPDELAGKPQAADLEVPRGALGLGPVIGLRRDVHLPHRIAFHPGAGQARALPLSSWRRISSRVVLASSNWGTTGVGMLVPRDHNRDYRSTRVFRYRPDWTRSTSRSRLEPVSFAESDLTGTIETVGSQGDRSVRSIDGWRAAAWRARSRE